jgi:pimeloyl-ACP methyl ester carboxylesterase
MGARESLLWHVAAHQKGADWTQKCVLQGAFGCDWRAAWTQNRVPATLIWGRNALRQGYDSAPEWLALRSDAHLEVIEEALTFPHLEQPARFLELVAKILDSKSELALN